MQNRPNALKISIFFNIIFALILSGYCLLPKRVDPLPAVEQPAKERTSASLQDFFDKAKVTSVAISRVTFSGASDDVDIYLYPIAEKKYISDLWCGGVEGKPIHDGTFGLFATTRGDNGKPVAIATLQLEEPHMFAVGTPHDGLRIVSMYGKDKFIAINQYGSCNGDYVELYEFTGSALRAVKFIDKEGKQQKSIPTFLGNTASFQVSGDTIETSSYSNHTGKYTHETYRYDGKNFVLEGIRETK